MGNPSRSPVAFVASNTGFNTVLLVVVAIEATKSNSLIFLTISRVPVGLPCLVLPPAFFQLSFEDIVSFFAEDMFLVFFWGFSF